MDDCELVPVEDEATALTLDHVLPQLHFVKWCLKNKNKNSY